MAERGKKKAGQKDYQMGEIQAVAMADEMELSMAGLKEKWTENMKV